MITLTINPDGTLSLAWPPGTPRAAVQDAIAATRPREPSVDRLVRLARMAGVDPKSSDYMAPELLEGHVRDALGDAKKSDKSLDDIEQIVEEYIERTDTSPIEDRVRELGRGFETRGDLLRMERGITASQNALINEIDRAVGAPRDAADPDALRKALVEIGQLIHAHKNPTPAPKSNDDDVPF